MSNDLQPWYRQFWPWFLIALPAVAVCASLYTVYLAASAPPALVVDDYKKIGLATRKSYELDEQARALNLEAGLTVGAGEAPVLTLTLTGILEQAPENLVLKLSHPTLSERDQRIILLAEGDVYVGVLPIRQARYYVQLEPADGKWRLSGQMHADSTIVMLGPRSQN